MSPANNIRLQHNITTTPDFLLCYLHRNTQLVPTIIPYHIIPFYIWGNLSTGRLSNTFKISQLKSDKI